MILSKTEITLHRDAWFAPTLVPLFHAPRQRRSRSKIGRSRDSNLNIHRLSCLARREAQVPSVLTASDDIRLAKYLLFIIIQCTFFLEGE